MMKLRWVPVVVFVLSGLYACSTGNVSPLPESSPPPQPEATPIPSATPIPIPHVLLISEGPVEWEGELADWVLDRGWHLNKPDLPGASIYLRESGLPIAAVSVGERLDGALETAADGGLAVVAVAVPGLEAAPFLSVVSGPRFDQMGFLAGVMTGLASETGWVGLVTATGSENASDYEAGFTQGLLWGCPKCQVIGQTAAELTLDRLRANSVDVVFILPGPGAAAAAEIPAAEEIPMVWIGEEGLANDVLVGRIAFREGALIVRALDELIATGEGQIWAPSIESGSITVVDINDDLLSPGRQRLLAEVYNAVASGELDIGTGPDL